MISSIMERIKAGEDPVGFVDAATLKLLKDSEDRAHGTPPQEVRHTGEEGGPLQVALVRFADDQTS